MNTDTDTDTETPTDAQWARALYLGILILLPAGIYFRAGLYTDVRTVAPLLAYCTVVAWFRPRTDP